MDIDPLRGDGPERPSDRAKRTGPTGHDQGGMIRGHDQSELRPGLKTENTENTKNTKNTENKDTIA